jgi:hypothetical protein
MKKIGLLLVLALGVFVLASCSGVASAAQGVVDLPDTLEANITALILVVVSWVLAQLIVLVPFLRFLEDFKTPLALGISAQLIGFIEAAVPDAYGAAAILAIQLILVVIGLFLSAETLRLRGVRGFRALK